MHTEHDDMTDRKEYVSTTCSIHQLPAQIAQGWEEVSRSSSGYIVTIRKKIRRDTECQ
jgi:hypothetical protein